MKYTPGLFAASILLSLPALARAAVVQYEFSGTLEEVPLALAGEFSPGETITGTFSVETTLIGFLFDASDLVVTIGGDYVVTGTVGKLSVLDDSSFDSFHASFDGPLTGTPVGALSPVEFDLALTLPPTAFSSTAVPTFIPLEGAVGVTSSIDFAPEDEETLTFRVASVTAVPEPSSTAMLGAGALLLARRRRAGAR